MATSTLRKKHSKNRVGRIETLETRKMMTADMAGGMGPDHVEFGSETRLDFPGIKDHFVAPAELYDFGDAPAIYPTLKAQDGPYHRTNGVYLGSSVDTEQDGKPHLRARGDDRAGIDDEDGVEMLTEWSPGCKVKIRVTASAHGFLNAFVDFHQDGEWGTTDQIFSGLELGPGTHELEFDVPADAKLTPNLPTFARFRFSSTHQYLGTTDEAVGPADVPDGEVEDHPIWIVEGGRPLPPTGDGGRGSSTFASPDHQQWVEAELDLPAQSYSNFKLKDVMVSSYSFLASDDDSEDATSADVVALTPASIDLVFAAV